jgi:hypothetical protein
MQTGKRVWKCELSTIDTAILMAGVLTAQSYFILDNAEEREIREIADFLYRRVQWSWACNGAATLSHGWSPERGFRRYRWDTNYSEALILYCWPTIKIVICRDNNLDLVATSGDRLAKQS